MRLTASLFVALALVASATAQDAPQFKLAWSEYPSWSAFGVASQAGLINGEAGKLGKLEEKYKVDIVLQQLEYDPCITLYNTGGCDAVCITNMDVLNPSLGRESVAILPTSTSKGADALIVPKSIKSIDDLRGMNVYGLEKSVSEYCFVRNLELLGKKETDFKFTNMDPGAAAQAMQVKDAKVQAIVVWNPFVLQTLKTRDDVHVLFDSAKIPGEIVDMVVCAKASLDKEGGDRFAKAVCETFYELCKMIEDPKTRKKTLVYLGKKFSNLTAEEMEEVVKQTVFYSSPEEGEKLLSSEEFKSVMSRVTLFCTSHAVIEKTPSIEFGSEKKDGINLRFDAQYIKAVKGEK